MDWIHRRSNEYQLLCVAPDFHIHYGDNIAEQIQLIFATYKLSSSKVTFAIMDNAANFRKAFREHGANDSAFVEYVESTQDENEAEIEKANSIPLRENFIFCAYATRTHLILLVFLNARVKVCSHSYSHNRNRGVNRFICDLKSKSRLRLRFEKSNVLKSNTIFRIK